MSNFSGSHQTKGHPLLFYLFLFIFFSRYSFTFLPFYLFTFKSLFTFLKYHDSTHALDSNLSGAIFANLYGLLSRSW